MNVFTGRKIQKNRETSIHVSDKKKQRMSDKEPDVETVSMQTVKNGADLRPIEYSQTVHPIPAWNTDFK